VIGRARRLQLLLVAAATCLNAGSSVAQTQECGPIEVTGNQQQQAADRWRALVEQNFRNRPRTLENPGLRYWSRIEGRPNVLIYGDSISIDYTSTVIAELEGKANVIRLPANGSHSGEIIAKMKAMQAAMSDPALADPWRFKWDIIHFNVGLHDFKYVASGRLDKHRGKIVNSVEKYRTNLITAIAYFRAIAPEAQLIFATTTPVPEGEAGRFVEDAVRYNKVAREVMEQENIPINDLHAFTLVHLDEWIIAPGNVHYRPWASKAQGREVARVIAQYLD